MRIVSTYTPNNEDVPNVTSGAGRRKGRQVINMRMKKGELGDA